MKKYLIKTRNNIILIEEDWRQSIIADTYTYLLIVVLAVLLYSYSSNFGRSVVFEISFVVIFGLKLLAMFKSKRKIIDSEEAKKVVDEFLA